ncbi:histidinol-phosphate transaminase [Desulfosporosinus sp.]|uniref:pyridoxal phosphate-dependent aminotransferase n=1 Tax=Desulfosporosinus sp. TaxID=157907 RepID=UPI0025C12ADF|nr:threonine-phosphate decarboxylase [Desulfosporosinus sp.]MBC2722223.1 aminotransferase class I/II-fold pyridoxal phosphate-dependent enzyme [Desulfosporosinus sp.]MBC2727251.1 aminotransferase class I/II-fold pyridoxal phosphate-dependent enzyme [Desulfosporosinus sp.]
MHGGNLRRAQELYGLDSFIDLSANINPFGPPSGVWVSLQKGMEDIVNYPDPESLALRRTLSRHLGQPMETIMVGNGAGELIFTVMQALKPQKVVIPIPTFSEYERAARAVGSEIQYVPLGPQGWATFSRRDEAKNNPDYERDNDQMWRELLKGCDLLFLCSPHNPTGSVLEQETFELILKITKEIGCNILFDESFFDFLPNESRESARGYMADNEHLIVLYSLTKFYSLPGLRLGTVFAHPSLLKSFEQYRDPWSVNVLAQHAGITALEDADYPDDVREKLQESKCYFYGEFAKCNFENLRLWPTSVNFALIEVLNQPPEKLIKHLGCLGILVRDCTSFEGLSGYFIRVAIKDIYVMGRLIEGLKQFFINGG